MNKQELAAALAAFEQNGGKVQEVKEGVSGGTDLDGLDSTLRFCACGCHGDWTDHRMRQAEGRFADQ